MNTMQYLCNPQQTNVLRGHWENMQRKNEVRKTKREKGEEVCNLEQIYLSKEVCQTPPHLCQHHGFEFKHGWINARSCQPFPQGSRPVGVPDELQKWCIFSRTVQWFFTVPVNSKIKTTLLFKRNMLLQKESKTTIRAVHTTCALYSDI